VIGRRLAFIAPFLIVVLGGSWVVGQEHPDPQPRESRAPVTATIWLPGKVAAKTLLLKTARPAYPKDARKKHIQGMVTVNARIGKDGDVTYAKAMSGDPALRQAAVDAVQQFKYKPYLVNGEAVEAETQVLINFSLADD
jgi:protein TonB